MLVLNLGSTSFKYEFFDSDLTSLSQGNFSLSASTENLQEEVNRIFRDVLREIGDISQIQKVVHRIVHGGKDFKEPLKITSENLSDIEKLSDLAPLHNPVNIAGIKASKEYLPEVDNWAVFDTAFFTNLPEAAKVYPIPYKYYQESSIQRFGFHGISHQFASHQAAKEIKKDFEKINIISLHLGGGASACAIQHGQPIDISMGYTPLEGLMMQTRSGSLDPAVVLELARQEGVEETQKILNSSSGILGISGKNDYLELLSSVERKEPRAELAFGMYINQIKKYIGAYAALLGEVDLIVFTGKVGAGDKRTRQAVLADISFFKKIPVVTVDPHEELAIAEEINML